MSIQQTGVYQRGARIATAFVIALAGFTAILPFFLTQNASAATVAITQVAFTTTERSVGVDQASESITVEMQNVLGQPETVDSDTNLSVISNSSTGGQFSLDGSTWGAGPGSFTINAGTASSSFFYRDSVAGTHSLTATVTNPTLPEQTWNTTQTITVLPDTEPPVTGLAVDTSHAYGGTLHPVVTADGSCTDPNRPNAQCTYKYTLVDQTNTEVNSSTQTTPQWQPTITNLPSGTYTVGLTVSDEANNASTATPATITVDNTSGVTIANDDESYMGGNVQPQLINDSDATETMIYTWAQNDNNPAALVFNQNAREPIFRPTIAGTYDFLLTICDGLGNCSDITYSFSWRPLITAAVTQTVATTPPPEPPVGLVTTQFNTTSPKALGVTTAGSSAQTSSATAPVEVSQKPKEKEIAATYADSPSDRIWWILLILALLAAGYYAYRNWQLTKSKAA